MPEKPASARAAKAADEVWSYREFGGCSTAYFDAYAKTKPDGNGGDKTRQQRKF